MINSEFSDICSIIPGVDDFIELDFKKVAERFLDRPGFLEEPYTYLEDFFSRIKKNRFDKIINVTPHDTFSPPLNFQLVTTYQLSFPQRRVSMVNSQQ